MNNTDHINLIHKQLSGEITAEELAQLQEWIAASEDNRFTAETILAVWTNSSVEKTEIDLDIDIDLDEEFELLNARIEAEEAKEIAEEEEPRIISMRRRMIGVAAAAVVLIGATFVWNAIDSLSGVEWAELKTTNEPREILLADGSEIHLNANSTLRYPEQFTGDTREVELSGEGFFDIAKDAEHPFIVHTSYEDVTVLGTSFNVRAYPNDVESVVSVSTGKVRVTAEEGEQLLLPNEKAVVIRDEGTIEMGLTEGLNEMAWHTGTVRFNDAMVPDALSDLEDAFEVTFYYDANLLSECSFTSTFNLEKDELSDVLKVLSKVLSCTINDLGDDQYQLIGGSCE